VIRDPHVWIVHRSRAGVIRELAVLDAEDPGRLLGVHGARVMLLIPHEAWQGVAGTRTLEHGINGSAGLGVFVNHLEGYNKAPKKSSVEKQNDLTSSHMHLDE
jgi:hypothetical protein